MSDVLFAAVVAQRSGTDLETADRVIAAASGLIRDMALAGSGCTLTGVGKFEVQPARAGKTSRSLTFKPVGKLQRIPSRA